MGRVSFFSPAIVDSSPREIDDGFIVSPRSQNVSAPVTPSKSVVRVTPRKGTVTPSKSPQPHLPAPMRLQRQAFFLQQVPAGLSAARMAEVRRELRRVLGESVPELRRTREELQSQLESETDEEKRLVAQFLERVAKDVLGELEAGRGQQTPVKRRQEEKIQTPIRTSQKRLPDDLVSPSKGRQDQPRVSEDTVKRVKVAIEKDNGISYLVKTKQSLPFDKLVSCVRVFVWYRA